MLLKLKKKKEFITNTNDIVDIGCCNTNRLNGRDLERGMKETNHPVETRLNKHCEEEMKHTRTAMNLSESFQAIVCYCPMATLSPLNT